MSMGLGTLTSTNTCECTLVIYLACIMYVEMLGHKQIKINAILFRNPATARSADICGSIGCYPCGCAPPLRRSQPARIPSTSDPIQTGRSPTCQLFQYRGVQIQY